MDSENSNVINSIAASGLVSASVLASLIGSLASKGILTDAEVREIYDQALFLIEAQQAESDSPRTDDIYKSAREIIEDQLRG